MARGWPSWTTPASLAGSGKCACCQPCGRACYYGGTVFVSAEGDLPITGGTATYSGGGNMMRVYFAINRSCCPGAPNVGNPVYEGTNILAAGGDASAIADGEICSDSAITYTVTETYDATPDDPVSYEYWICGVDFNAFPGTSTISTENGNVLCYHESGILGETETIYVSANGIWRVIVGPPGASSRPCDLNGDDCSEIPPPPPEGEPLYCYDAEDREVDCWTGIIAGDPESTVSQPVTCYDIDYNLVACPPWPPE
jgi:hypothetical protein